MKEIILFVILPILFLGLAILFGEVTILAKETIMKSLIEAEATILGFLGLIVVYILKSLDDREDKWDERWLDLTRKGEAEEVPNGLETTRGEICRLFISDIQTQRRKTIRLVLVIGIYLISSMLLSILALGVLDVVFTGLLSMLAVSLFLLSVLSMFLLFSKIAKSHEEIP